MPPTRLRDASSVAQRLVAAVAAGYGLAVLSGVLSGELLAAGRFDAAMIGLLVSFLAYAAAIVWAFAARRLWTMWLGLMLPAMLSAGLIFLAKSIA
jgi:hypothetical protein